jgi:hypothetical protein
VQANYPGVQITDVASPLWTQAAFSQIKADVGRRDRNSRICCQLGRDGAARPDLHLVELEPSAGHVGAGSKRGHQAGMHFSLWIAYLSSARIRTLTQINNDLSYLVTTYGTDPAFDRSNSGRPTLIMMGSRKYSQPVLD